MKEFVVYEGKVTECKEVGCTSGKTMSFTTINGVHVTGRDSRYYCDKNGKSKIDGDYYNFKDYFFPFENGTFNKQKLIDLKDE